MRLSLTVAQKLLMLVSIPLLFQLGFIALIVNIQRKSEEAQMWSLHAEGVTAQAYTLLDLLVEADADLRAGIVTGYSDFFDSHDETAQGISDALGQLQNLVQGNATQEAMVRGMAAQLEEKLTLMAMIAAAVRDKTGEPGVVRTQLAHNHLITRAMQQDMVAFVQEALKASGSRQAEVERFKRQLHVLLGGGTVAVILLHCRRRKRFLSSSVFFLCLKIYPQMEGQEHKSLISLLLQT